MARRPPVGRGLWWLGAVAATVAAVACTAPVGGEQAAPTSSVDAAGTTAATAPATSYDVPAEPPPVYVLVLDELPVVDLLTGDGDLNATRFPRFAELAGRSTWYTDWTVHSGRTIHSVPSLLSGVLPRNVLATPEEYPTNLVDGLGSAGWGIDVLEHNSWLCSTARCPDRLPFPKPETRQAAVVLDRYLARLDERTWPDPTLHLLHLVAPHPPWTRLPDGTTTGPVEVVVGSRWPPTPWVPTAVAEVESRWMLGDTDRALGQWMDAIEARGEWDDALVVVTADHGEDRRPGHNSRDIGTTNQRELVWVPTFVKLPGQRDGRVDPTPHSSTQLAGMVYDAVGVARPPGIADRPRRVVVTDVWPYDDVAELTFAPLHEGARPTVTGRVVDGPGWEGLVDEARRRVLPEPVVSLVGRPVEELVPSGGSLALGPAAIDHLDALLGASPGECGWDLTVSGDLVGPPDPSRPFVALAAGGVVVGVAPVEPVWPGAPVTVEGRASYLRVLVDPADVATYGDVALLAVDPVGAVVGRYELEPAAEAGELVCPA